MDSDKAVRTLEERMWSISGEYGTVCQVIRAVFAELERLREPVENHPGMCCGQCASSITDAEQRAEQAEAVLEGAEERLRLLFEAKNRWADRAREAETALAHLQTQYNGCNEERIAEKGRADAHWSALAQMTEERNRWMARVHTADCEGTAAEEERDKALAALAQAREEMRVALGRLTGPGGVVEALRGEKDGSDA